MSGYVHETPVFRPTKEEFNKPFCEYIGKVLKKHPDVAMFKVVPPEGWRPRRSPFPKLQKLDIQCPIKQLVFGTRGSYRCMLVEQKPLNAYEFRDIAEDADHLPPNKERDKEDKLLERAFWSSVTINPPLYGADTPMSFFDEKLPYGWNLRDLGCLLKRPEVPQVPGVTTPMTYFGMWKSFFAWHVEDADLFSINYLHFGAPKVWYCVSPGHRAKFERMAQSMFPELHKGCPAFMRHKDILLSPSLLKNYGVEYMQTKQEPNEFIVLNAGAYHAGYNLGFNCAEAVNFATDEWIDLGRNVVRCKCDALGDGVRISMRLFGCSSGSSGSTTTEEDSGSEDEEDPGSGCSQDSQPDSQDSEQAESEEVESSHSVGEHEGTGKAAAGRRGKAAAAGSSKRSAAAAAAAAAVAGSASKRSRTAEKEKAAAAAAASAGTSLAGYPAPRGPRQTKTALAAAAAAAKMRRTHATAEARAKLAVAHGRVVKHTSGRDGSKGGSSSSRRTSSRGVKKTHLAKPARVYNKAETLGESLQRAAAAAAAIRARAQEEAAAVKQQQQPDVKQEDEQQQSQQQQQVAEVAEVQQELQGLVKAEPAAAAAATANAGSSMVLTRRRSSGTNNTAPAAAAAGDPDSLKASKAKLQMGGVMEAGAAGATAAAPSGDAPQVIIGEDRGTKYFYMVQVLRDVKPKQRGRLVMRWLKEGRDGLFRPSSDTWEEAPRALVGVRTQWVGGSGGRAGGYRLLTLRSRILDTDLVD